MRTLRGRCTLRSGARCDMPSDIPDKGGELAGERDADLVVLQAARLETAVAMTQTQLRAPGDLADRCTVEAYYDYTNTTGTSNF